MTDRPHRVAGIAADVTTRGSKASTVTTLVWPNHAEHQRRTMAFAKGEIMLGTRVEAAPHNPHALAAAASPSEWAAVADEPNVFRILADAVEALVGLGQLDRAEQLLGPWEEEAERVGLAWSLATSARCRALYAAATGDIDGARHAAARSLAHHQRLAMPFELARTLLVQGQIERRAKQKLAARRPLQQALAIFEGLGAPLWAARAQAELDRTGRRTTAPDELTTSERRVAELAATGLTNRQVGAALFVSGKTVEANLGRVYRKLAIKTRADLGIRLAAVPA